MWLNLVFFIAFCGQAISESLGLKTIDMISVFIRCLHVMLHMKHPRVFLRAQDHGSLSPMIKVALLKFLVFCRRAISESPDLRTMYMISVFIGVYMFVAHETFQGGFLQAQDHDPCHLRSEEHTSEL